MPEAPATKEPSQEAPAPEAHRRPSITERVKSAFGWSPRGSPRGSGRRPRSPKRNVEVPPRRSSVWTSDVYQQLDCSNTSTTETGSYCSCTGPAYRSPGNYTTTVTSRNHQMRRLLPYQVLPGAPAAQPPESQSKSHASGSTIPSQVQPQPKKDEEPPIRRIHLLLQSQRAYP